LARTVLGIYVEGDQIRAAVARTVRSNVQWLRFFQIDWESERGEPNLQELISRFREGLDESGISWDEVSIALDPNSVALRVFDFPFASPKKIEEALPMQLEDALPFELENFTYDFELLSRGKGQNRALVALVEKARLENLLETSTAAGLEPTLVTTATSAVVRFIPGARVRGRWILVHAGNKKATAILAIDNKPLANTTLEIDRGDPRGVASKLLTLLRSQTEVEPESPEDVLKIVPAADDSWRPFFDELAKLLHAQIVDAAEALDQPIPAGHLPAAGAALSATGFRRHRSINFRKDEFVYHRAKSEQQRVILRVGVMVAILLLLALAQGIYKYASLKSELDALDKRAVEIFSSALPNTPALKPTEQLKGQLEVDKKKMAVLGGIAGGRLTTIDALKKISESIPETVMLDVTKLEVNPESIRISGKTNDYESVDRIVSELGKVKEFVAIHKDEARKIGDSEIRFRLTVTLVERGAGPS